MPATFTSLLIAVSSVVLDNTDLDIHHAQQSLKQFEHLLFQLTLAQYLHQPKISKKLVWYICLQAQFWYLLYKSFPVNTLLGLVVLSSFMFNDCPLGVIRTKRLPNKFIRSFVATNFLFCR